MDTSHFKYTKDADKNGSILISFFPQIITLKSQNC